MKYGHKNRIGLTTVSLLFFLFQNVTFLKLSGVFLSMAKDEQVQMPSSQGGLVQYFDADEGVEIDPKTVIAFSAGIGMLTLGLHMGILG